MADCGSVAALLAFLRGACPIAAGAVFLSAAQPRYIDMNTTLRFSFACTVLVAAHLSAQTSPKQTSPRDLLQHVRVPIQVNRDPDGPDRGLWTAGHDWRASLHDGVAFEARQPAHVGSVPWRWRTTGCTVGGICRPLAEPRPHVVGEHRCEYALGPVTEAYDVRVGGLEQTFVLRERTDRDVILSGAVQTALTAEPRGFAHGPLDFLPLGPGNGVRYGAAFAVDAAGDRLPLSTAWDGEQLRIQVPGAWLARAAWPVVVDPLLSTVLLDATTTTTVRRVVVERDERNNANQLGVVLVREQPAGGYDLFFLLVDDDLQSPTVVFSRFSITDPDPTLAYVSGPNRWLLGFTTWDYNTGGERGVLHVHTGGSTVPDNSIDWAPNVPGRRQRALRIGGNRSAGPSGASFMVWESESTTTSGNTGATRIYGCLYDAASGTAGAPVHLAGGNASFPGDSEAPSITRDRGLGSWVVAWQHQSGLPFHWDVVAQRVGSNGVVAAGTFFSDRVGLEHQLAPVVDGQHGEYLVAFRSVPLGALTSTTQNGHVLRAQTFTWGDGSIAPTATRPSQTVVGSATYPAYRADAVAFDRTTGAHWAVSTSQVIFTTPRTALVVLGSDGRARENLYLANTDSAGTGVAFDDDADQFVVCFGETQNGFHRANLVRFAYPAQQPPSSYGSGCGGALNLGVGSFRAGDPDNTLRLDGATAAAPAILAAGLAPATAPLPAPFLPGCTLLVDLSPASAVATLAMVTGALGRADVPLPLPSNLPDLDLHVQWIYLNALGTGFLATNGLRVEIR